MVTRKKIILISAGIAFTIAMITGHRWSRNHVDYITASTGHPLKCTSCHLYMQQEGPLTKIVETEYVSPFNMTISPDGQYLYVVGQENNSLNIIDLKQNSLIKKVLVGDHPHSVVVNDNGTSAFVTNQWSNNVMEIKVPEGKIIRTLGVGHGPSGITLDSDNKFLYAVNTFSSDVSVIDLSSGEETRRLPVGNNPTGVKLSPDGQQLMVLSRRTLPVAFRSPPKVEISFIDTHEKRLIDKKEVESAHIMENVDYLPDGELALFTLIRPKNLVPALQIENGWMINFGLGVYQPATGKSYQLLLDEPNEFYADPFDIKISPDGQRAVVSHSGADYLSIIDINALKSVLSRIDANELSHAENDLSLSDEFVIKRIKTGSAPKGLTFSPDGSRLYYAEYLTDEIGVVDFDNLVTGHKIKLSQADQNTVIRRGQRMFYNASHTFQNQYSCYTCHPDGHEDGLTYDMAPTPGMDITNVQTLRELPNTAPYKWNGKNVSVYMQCGMRFSKYVTRTESFSPEDLDALVAYILTQLKHPPNMYRQENGELTEAQQRGKAIFERTVTNDGRNIPVENQCITCHPAPNYTDRKTSDVGTRKSHDHPDMAFDSPNLNNVYESAPYLHDGSAKTLEEIWTRFNDYDQHGVANDLTKNQLNDMIEYLKSLGSSHYYK